MRDGQIDVRRPLRALIVLPLLLTVSQGVASAQETWVQPPNFSLTLGTQFWATSGFSDHSHSSLIKPVSELTWRGVDALIPEVFADVVWKRLVVRGAFGRGDITDGEFIDEDFSASNRQVRFSVTKSDVDGDLFYANGDVGVRVLRWASRDGRRGYVDVLGGYQYWREEYEAFGLTGAQDPTGGANLVPIPPISSNVKVLTRDYAWQNVRIGGRWEVPIPRGIGFRAEVFFIPWSKFELRDVHPLRTTDVVTPFGVVHALRQDPSGLFKATGGFGYEFEGALSYTIGRGLAVEGGLRYWNVKSGEGDGEIRTVNFGTLKVKSEVAETERYGPFIGFRYRF